MLTMTMQPTSARKFIECDICSLIFQNILDFTSFLYPLINPMHRWPVKKIVELEANVCIMNLPFKFKSSEMSLTVKCSLQ